MPAPHERVDVEASSPWWGEQRSRYHLAARYASDRVVLDIACGSGAGLEILDLAGARSLVGIDISEAAVRRSRSRRTRARIVRASGVAIPLADASVGLVTSFETIEHLPDPDLFLSEIRRVLAPNGVAIFSTPNARVSRPVNGQPKNPFHVHEYEPDELAADLRQVFGRVTLLGQRPATLFRPCPFWEPPEAYQGLRTLPSATLWKIQVRLPEKFRAAVERLRRHPTFPGEHDFSFSPDDLRLGHCLVAICDGSP